MMLSSYRCITDDVTRAKWSKSGDEVGPKVGDTEDQTAKPWRQINVVQLQENSDYR